MATTSFGRKFYVSEDNIDTFVSVVTAPSEEETEKKFQSKQITGEALKGFLEGKKIKND